MSTRMGRDKALLPSEEPGFETLLTRQVALLQELGLTQILISLRRDTTCPDAGLMVIRDETEGLGPLGGIVAAMRLAPHRRLLVLAVDLARVDAPFLRSLLGRSFGASGAAPRVSGRWEPLCAIYPPNSLALAEEMLAGPTRSPSALVAALASEGAMTAYVVPAAKREQLRSWNRPEDLPPTIRARSGVGH